MPIEILDEEQCTHQAATRVMRILEVVVGSTFGGCVEDDSRQNRSPGKRIYPESSSNIEV